MEYLVYNTSRCKRYQYHTSFRKYQITHLHIFYTMVHNANFFQMTLTMEIYKNDHQDSPMYHRIEDIYNRENHQNYQMLQRFLVFSPIINTFFLVGIIKDTVKEQQYHKHAPQDLNLHLTDLESAVLPIAPRAYKKSQ